MEMRINDKLWNTAAQVIQYPLANPKEPHMRDEKTQSQTFTPKLGRARAEVLAKAGFYKHPGDHLMRCYYCGVKIEWQELSENIALAHVRNSPDCEHINRLCGYPIIREIKQFYGVANDLGGDVTDHVPAHALDRRNQA